MKKTRTVVFTVSGRDFNAIMSVCAPATSRDGKRETLERIEVRLEEGHGIATAMDGYIMTQYRFEYRQSKPLRGAWLLPRFRQMRADSEVTLTITPKMVSADDGMTVVAAYVDQNPYVNWQMVIENRAKKETVHRVFFQKSVLMKALKCVKGDEPLMLEMAGPKDAVVLRSTGMSGLILPAVIHADPEKFFCRLAGMKPPEGNGDGNGDTDGQDSAGRA